MRPRTTKWSLANLLGRSRPPAARRDTTYHAVSIVPGEDACEAARRFAGQRLLSRQAPPLPLPACDAAQCRCRFRHYQDRRAGPRRRNEIGLIPANYAGKERRQGRGRRADDF